MSNPSERRLRIQTPTAHDLAKLVLSITTRLENQTGKPELQTNIRVIDDYCQGLHKGQIFTIGGRPGDGKTSLMLQIALGLVKNQVKTTIISLEMTAEQVMERLFSLEMEVDTFANQKLAGQFIPKRVFDALCELGNYSQEWKKYLHIIDDFGYTTAEMIRLFDDIYEDKPQVVLIDHLQHIRCENRKTLEAIDDYLLMTKEFAKKNGICFVVLSQVNRQGNEKPTLAHLKSSGKIEEISDSVLLIETDKLKLDQNNCKFHIAKQRYGPVGTHELYFCGAYTKFYNHFDDYSATRTARQKTVNIAKDFKTYIAKASSEPRTEVSTDPLDRLVERDCEV